MLVPSASRRLVLFGGRVIGGQGSVFQTIAWPSAARPRIPGRAVGAAFGWRGQQDVAQLITELAKELGGMLAGGKPHVFMGFRFAPSSRTRLGASWLNRARRGLRWSALFLLRAQRGRAGRRISTRHRAP